MFAEAIDVFNYEQNSGASRLEQQHAAIAAMPPGGAIVRLHWASGHGAFAVYRERATALRELDRHVGHLASGAVGRRTSDRYVDLTPEEPGYEWSWIEILQGADLVPESEA